jgi:hypothetical protein
LNAEGLLKFPTPTPILARYGPFYPDTAVKS